MKLNNGGWGLGVFIAYLCMFFLVLLLIAYLANGLGNGFN